jgi:transposase-like protein
MRRIDVGPRPASRDELAAWYAEALEAQTASGLSVAEFAGRIGVSTPTFYAWRRRLGASAPRELPAKLVEVTVTRASSGATAVRDLVVRLCSGRRSIDVPAGFDDAELRRLVATLESC